MDSQAQLKRNYGHHQGEEPIRIHHPEEEEHHEKGPSKVLKKVKEKAKKIKKALTKHGHGHEQDRGEHIPDDHDLDEEDDEDDDQEQQIHGGAPARGKAHTPVKEEEIVPPGTRVFPVVSSSHTKPSEPIRGVESVRGSYTSHGHGAPSRPVRASDVSEKEERRGATTLTPHNTPVTLLSATEDVTRTFVPGENESRDQRKVNIERPRRSEEDPAAPGKGLGSLGGMSNYQSKVTDPTGRGNNFSLPPFGNSNLGLGRDLPERSHMKSGPEMGNHGSGLGKEIPARRHEFDVKSGTDLPTRTQAEERGDEMQQPNQSSYTDKIASATSAVAEKAVAAKNAVASKLGYSGDGGNENRVEGEETPSSGGGYGSMVSEKLTPIYEKVKETGATVMTKLPLSGGGTVPETETQQGQDKGVSAREYLTEKLSPGEEDKALSEVVTEKLHLGENTTAPAKKGIVTQSEEVEKRLGGFSDQRSQEERKHGEAFAEEGEGGMAEKLRGAVTSWLAGTTEEAVQKSTESSSQSLGSTVGNIAAGQTDGGNNSGCGSVPVQKRFQESGN